MFDDSGFEWGPFDPKQTMQCGVGYLGSHGGKRSLLIDTVNLDVSRPDDFPARVAPQLGVGDLSLLML